MERPFSLVKEPGRRWPRLYCSGRKANGTLAGNRRRAFGAGGLRELGDWLGGLAVLLALEGLSPDTPSPKDALGANTGKIGSRGQLARINGMVAAGRGDPILQRY